MNHPVICAAIEWSKSRDVYHRSSRSVELRDEADIKIEQALIENGYMPKEEAITDIKAGITRLYITLESGIELQIPTGKY